MKFKLSILLLLLCASVNAQTNVYLANMVQQPKTKTTCSGKDFYYVGNATYIPSGTNAWGYQPGTNVIRISFTNANPEIYALSYFGEVHCGHGSLVWTDAFFPNQTYRFAVYWSNNVTPVPTNQMIPLTTVGFTNSP